VHRLPRVLLAVAATLVALPCLGVAGLRVAAASREQVPREEAAPASGHFVRAGDVTMFVQEEGPASGPPVVFVHGTGAWSEIWRGTMGSLAAAGYRAIALDMPPFGYSERPASADYGDEAQARRILGALDALHLDRVTLVGHSFGGRPTMEATFLAPGRVSALVLVDAALGLQRTGDDAPPSPLLRATLGVRPLRDALVASTLTNPLLTRRLLRTLVSDTAAATRARVRMLQRPFVVEGTTASFGEWLLPFATTGERSLATDRARYATLTMPTLVIWGTTDAITPLAQGRDVARVIPGARLVELPGVGHIPAIEAPAGFDAALLRFLDDVSGRDRP
jgi:pimeloyl-ACP methyl ester carboxylesterase